jgi:hypothetical protein
MLKLAKITDWKKAQTERPVVGEDNLSKEVIVKHNNIILPFKGVFNAERECWVFEKEAMTLNTLIDVEWMYLEKDQDTLNEMYDVALDNERFMLELDQNKRYYVKYSSTELGMENEIGDYDELIHVSYMRTLELNQKLNED